MNRFKNILVAASPGHLEVPVLKKAARIAASNGAMLTVLDVVEPIPPRRRTVNVEGRTVDLQTLLLDDRRQQLTAAIESARVSDALVAVEAGKPFIEVTRYAMAHDCDLVILGESPPVQGRSRVVASDITQLIRVCPTPVWVMYPSRARKVRTLALVDPDPDDPIRDSLNDSVLELATSVTRAENGELHMAHAWQLPAESTLRSSAFASLPAREVNMMVVAASEEHRLQLEELAERHGVTEIGGETHLIKGAPEQVLPDLAEELNINLIVMGTVGRRGLSGLIMGNTAESMMRAVHCSILAVKPEGFVSPVSAD